MIRKALQFDNSFLQSKTERDEDEERKGKINETASTLKTKPSHQDRDSVLSDALV